MNHSKNYLADTNILINMLIQDHIHLSEEEKKLVEFVNATPTTRLVISSVVIIEFLDVVKRVVITKRLKLAKDNQIKLLRSAVTMTNKLLHETAEVIYPSTKTLSDSLEIFQKYRGLSFVDSLLITTCKEGNYILLTGDKELAEVNKREAYASPYF